MLWWLLMNVTLTCCYMSLLTLSDLKHDNNHIHVLHRLEHLTPTELVLKFPLSTHELIKKGQTQFEGLNDKQSHSV